MFRVDKENKDNSNLPELKPKKIQSNCPQGKIEEQRKPNMKIPTEEDIQMTDSSFSQFFPRVEIKNKVDCLDYERFENDYLLRIYGSDVFRYIKYKERVAMKNNFLAKHNVSKEIRTKMVDWILEVFYIYDYSDQTFFLAVHILDTYIANSEEILENKDIHILGMISMFLASKFEESEHIKMNFLFDKIGHKTFSKEELKEKERNVLTVISPDALVTTSTSESISCFLQDFKPNNREKIQVLKIEKFLDFFEAKAIYFGKMIAHFDNFTSYPAVFKAVACLITAFNDLHNQPDIVLSKEADYFMREWLKYLTSVNIYEFQYDEILTKINEANRDYHDSDFIGHSLKKHYQKAVDKLKA